MFYNIESILTYAESEEIIQMLYHTLLEKKEEHRTLPPTLAEIKSTSNALSTSLDDIDKVIAFDIAFKMAEGCLIPFYAEHVKDEDKLKFLRFFIQSTCEFEKNLLKTHNYHYMISQQVWLRYNKPQNHSEISYELPPMSFLTRFAIHK